MPDQLDLIRRFFTGLNRGDADGLRGFYDPGCVAEHVFVDDQGVVEGRAAVIAGWQREFSRYAGALAGGHRVEVTRVAGIETGWGWVRSEWFSALRSEEDALPRYFSGHSHFWVEDGAIRRHRPEAMPLARAPRPARAGIPRGPSSAWARSSSMQTGAWSW